MRLNDIVDQLLASDTASATDAKGQKRTTPEYDTPAEPVAKADGAAETVSRARGPRIAAPLTDAQRQIDIGSAVRVCAGPLDGSEGTVTSANKAWLKVQLRDGEGLSVRRFMLQPQSPEKEHAKKRKH